MTPSASKSSIFDLLSPVLADEGIELVDVEFEEGRGRKTLRLLIYKPDGVNLDDCQSVNRIALPILKVHGAISGKYDFEVSSPGLDRPLATEADFRRNLGRKIHVQAYASTGDVLQLNGILKDINEGKLFLNQLSGQTVQIALSDIAEAKIQLMW